MEYEQSKEEGFRSFILYPHEADKERVSYDSDSSANIL